VTKKSEGLIRGALIVSERQIGNKAYEVIMQVVQVDHTQQIQQQASISSQASNYVSIGETQGYEDVSMDISPQSVSKSSYQAMATRSPKFAAQRFITPSPFSVANAVQHNEVQDDEEEAPDWLFDKDKDGNVIPDRDIVLEKKIADLERINKLKEMTIKSIKRQNSM
ncbi:hypothetical protein MJH12_05195, partial [bacterium]|nr:hypothetical protein [bacterium]